VIYPSEKNVKGGLIVMGDLDRRKKNDLIVMGDLPKWKEYKERSHCNWWPTQDKKYNKWFHYNGWPAQMENKRRWYDRARREMRAQRCIWREVGLGNALPERIRAQRRTRNEIRIENALPERWGSKVHSKRGRVRKSTTQEVRTQRRTRKEIMVKHQFVKNESKALWSICMYNLRNIGPLFFMESSFSQKFESCKLQWHFLFCLLESYLVILTSRKSLISSYFFVL